MPSRVATQSQQAHRKHVLPLTGIVGDRARRFYTTDPEIKQRKNVFPAKKSLASTGRLILEDFSRNDLEGIV